MTLSLKGVVKIAQKFISGADIYQHLKKSRKGRMRITRLHAVQSSLSGLLLKTLVSIPPINKLMGYFQSSLQDIDILHSAFG
jgi:hypothetical protein